MLDLENLGQTCFCMTFHISGCKHDTKSILVSILTFSRSRISKIIKTNTWPYRLTLKLKVMHFFHMTLLISGCMHAIYSILVSNLTYSRSRISENLFPVTWPWCLTLIFKVKPLLFTFRLFSRSVIIDTLFISDFLSSSTLIMLKINTEIKSAACIQPEMMKVIWKYVWLWFSRSTMEVRRHMLVILRFQTSDMFKLTPTLCLYHVYNTW